MFGARLREMRMKRDITQAKFSEMLDIALRSYQCYEGGTRRPSFDLLVQMCDILNVPADYLLGRDEYLRSIGVDPDQF